MFSWEDGFRFNDRYIYMANILSAWWHPDLAAYLSLPIIPASINDHLEQMNQRCKNTPAFCESKSILPNLQIFVVFNKPE
ncbi:MAG: hypothetical protein EA394_02910 [Bacteroidia bacterium]|nr:MAG: hypothetical protein EA394_02910 [Bacteroidia bacterium]